LFLSNFSQVIDQRLDRLVQMPSDLDIDAFNPRLNSVYALTLDFEEHSSEPTCS
jgi:hypothetical protein